MSEILNIDYHTKRLVLKALNLYGDRYHKAAAQSLGISMRTLFRYKHDLEIEYDEETKQFYSKRQEAVLIP